MHSEFGFLSVFALSGALSVGCGGTESACHGTVCDCTEAGIRAAIAKGGGPYTFDCEGPTTVVTEAEIVIDQNVILDGEGNLTVDGDEDHRLFMVPEGKTVELRGLSITRGSMWFAPTETAPLYGGGIYNKGALTLIDATVSDNGRASRYVSGNTWSGGGIDNEGTLALINSTVSGNGAHDFGGGIDNAFGILTLINSTVSGNSADDGGGIYNGGVLTLVNSTLAGNTAPHGGSGILNTISGAVTMTNTVVDNDCCPHDTFPLSSGGNIESPGDTCTFTRSTDQVNVSPDDLKLGPLQDNGGPTMTHALLPGSVAIDKIPVEDCVDADGQPLTTDQRGEPRPAGDGCDVGAFEVQP